MTEKLGCKSSTQTKPKRLSRALNLEKKSVWTYDLHFAQFHWDSGLSQFIRGWKLTGYVSREGLEERAKSRQNLCWLYAQSREVYEDFRQTFRHLVLLDSCPSIGPVKQNYYCYYFLTNQ